MRLSHIAIACPNIDVVANQLRVLLLQIKERHSVDSEKVSAAMIPVAVSKDFRIELLEPAAPDSPISKFLAKRPSGGLHHVSFEVDNIDEWKKTLEKANIDILPPGLRQLARGRALFIHPKDMGGVLVELEEIR